MIFEPAETVSNPAENILEGSFVSYVTPFVIFEPSLETDGVTKMILEPAKKFFEG
jgi:hypothetical protein